MDEVHHGGGERPFLGTPVAHLFDTLYEGWDRGAVSAVDERWAATFWSVLDELARRAEADEEDERLRRLFDVTLDLLVSTMPAIAKVGDGALLDQVEAHLRRVYTEEVHRFRLVGYGPLAGEAHGDDRDRA